ncbi:unnamed protein product [Prorocentrum cordatum]|uniref:Uncharacterized protein n=1 Tax=Prorocentrum cordatum TaxID=2364126 RepID=A0ABN9UNN4_9DINO|nr:unnamed protein product [Polarella glacialis]
MACSSGDQWQHVLALLREVWTASLELGVICHDVGVSAWEMGGQWRRSLSLLREAVRMRLEPNVEICSNVVGVCERSGHPSILGAEGVASARGALASEAGLWGAPRGLVTWLGRAGLSADTSRPAG